VNDEQQELTNQPQGSRASNILDKPCGNHKNEISSPRHQRSTATTAGVGKKPPASSRRIEANRRNASKSTGPRTASGKRTVARNALKHGFFSKWLLIPHPDGKEDPTEYQDFYAALREHYHPLDFLEELWVDKIASWSWRLRRLVRCESGQIARALAEHNHEIKQLSVGDPEELELPELSSPEIDAITDHLFLPPKEELDKLLRYEAMINKQLNHAIAELERLQRRRNGESVPAPISVDITGRD
jgi:hypothetical protein